jgi:DNA-binding beta-propeller fold protein YncE
MEEVLTKYKFDSEQSGAVSSIYGYKPNNKGMLQVFGELYGVVSLAVESDVEMSRIMGLLLDELQESYFQEGKLHSDLKDFEGSLRRMRKRLEAILEREPELAASGLDMEAAFVVIKEDILYAAVIGESSIFVAREEEINEISGALVDPDQDKFMRTGSLRLLPDDRVLLVTDVVSGGNREEVIVGSLVDFTLSGVDIRRGAALLVGYGIDPALAAEPEPELEPEVEPEIEMEVEPEVVALKEPVFVEEEESPTLTLGSPAPAVSRPTRAMAIPAMFASIVEQAKQRLSKIDFSAAQDKARQLIATAKSKLKRQPSAYSGAEHHVAERVAPLDRLRRGASGGDWKGKILDLVARVRGDKMRYIIAGVVILILALSFALYQENQRVQRQKQLDALATQINETGEKIEALVIDAGAVTNDAVGQKQELVDRAEQLETDLNRLGANAVIDDTLNQKIETLRADIRPAVDEALRVNGFSQVQVIADLGAKFQDAKPVGLALAGGKLYVIDQKRNVLYEMPANNSNVDVAEVASGLKSPYLIDNDADGNIVLVDTNADSVISRYDIDSNKLTRMEGLSSDKEGKLQAIDIWSNNNALYALSAAKQSVVRQDDIAGSYSLPDFNTPWKKDTQFTEGKDIAVDGFVYVLVSGKGVQKYLSGQLGTLKTIGIMPEDKQIVAAATQMAVTAKRVFVADSASKTIISLVKDPRNGERIIFEGKYEYRGTDQAFTDIRDIVVNESDQKIFILEGNRVVRLSFASF